ncbi:serine-rich adhesin for platelets-like [Homarus americanus]|uniref:serine-rich adhesin for platelets-like n=1 Tax=Homarus americanus TaxID=6706 RepID=UPI001C48BA25|nr:serine-rich adhesin for platelets-like [Homarus americanus]
MKAALRAAAAITGAGALIYVLLRSRKRQRDPGKHDDFATFSSENITGTCSDVKQTLLAEELDTLGNDVSKESKDFVDKSDNCPYENFNGHVLINGSNSEIIVENYLSGDGDAVSVTKRENILAEENNDVCGDNINTQEKEQSTPSTSNKYGDTSEPSINFVDKVDAEDDVLEFSNESSCSTGKTDVLSHMEETHSTFDDQVRVSNEESAECVNVISTESRDVSKDDGSSLRCVAPVSKENKNAHLSTNFQDKIFTASTSSEISSPRAVLTGMHEMTDSTSEITEAERPSTTVLLQEKEVSSPSVSENECLVAAWADKETEHIKDSSVFTLSSEKPLESISVRSEESVAVSSYTPQEQESLVSTCLEGDKKSDVLLSHDTSTLNLSHESSTSPSSNHDKESTVSPCTAQVESSGSSSLAPDEESTEVQSTFSSNLGLEEGSACSSMMVVEDQGTLSSCLDNEKQSSLSLSLNQEGASTLLTNLNQVEQIGLSSSVACGEQVILSKSLNLDEHLTLSSSLNQEKGCSVSSSLNQEEGCTLSSSLAQDCTLSSSIAQEEGCTLSSSLAQEEGCTLSSSLAQEEEGCTLSSSLAQEEGCTLSSSLAQEEGCTLSSSLAQEEEGCTLSSSLAQEEGCTLSSSLIQDCTLSSSIAQEEGCTLSSSLAQEEGCTLSSSLAQEEEGCTLSSSLAQEEDCTLSSSLAQEEGCTLSSSLAQDCTLPSNLAQEEGCTLSSSLAQEEGCTLSSRLAQEEGCTLSSSLAQEEGCTLSSSLAQEEGCTLSSSLAQEEGCTLSSSLAQEEGCTLSSSSAQEEGCTLSSSLAQEEACTLSSSLAQEEGGTLSTSLNQENCTLSPSLAQEGGGTLSTSLAQEEDSTISSSSAPEEQPTLSISLDHDQESKALLCESQTLESKDKVPVQEGKQSMMSQESPKEKCTELADAEKKDGRAASTKCEETTSEIGPSQFLAKETVDVGMAVEQNNYKQVVIQKTADREQNVNTGTSMSKGDSNIGTSKLNESNNISKLRESVSTGKNTLGESSNTPKKADGSDKGTSRKEQFQINRGDSAATDLDHDPISEQENLNSDSLSLKSVDSGQGSSEIEPETLFNPSTFPASSQEQYIFYEFEIPQTLVGRLIGKKGAFVNKIKATTDATVIVYPHRDRRLKLCSVEGSKQQVRAALDMIRDHFPHNRYPDVSLEQVSTQQPMMTPSHPTLNTQAMQIELTAGVVVEVRVSAVVSGWELWVQQPLHPSYSALHRLQSCMNLNYGDGSNTPPLPLPVQDGTVCVAQIQGQWMRCQALSTVDDVTLVVLLDLGGTTSLQTSSLRQIRYDYMSLPFQAAQCFLHGVQPVKDDTWDDTSAAVMEELVSNTILFATVVSYTEDGVPLVNLYRRDNDQYVHLNEKLVLLGHARWMS